MPRITAGVLSSWLLMACSSAPGRPLRSPALDYSPPPPSTTDGDTVGADRRGPGDKLHEGVSSDGPAPGWQGSKSGFSYDPKNHVGGAVEPPPANGSSSK
jgi:hypothetical protein